ncbi:MAG: type II toxin-antitoxin system VapC family toxin [Spirulina sp.]
MKRNVLLDTGPLVALVNRREAFHPWAIEQWQEIESPFLTCEAVLTEACFLLQHIYGGEKQVLSFIRRNIICLKFNLGEEVQAIDELMQRYQSVPMSLADACLVRMAELNPASEILTLDSDFLIYRKFRVREAWL